MVKQKRIMGASIGNCVHVAGVVHFLELAENEGHITKFLGPAVSIAVLFENILQWKPEIVAIGYRLTPENVIPLLEEIKAKKELLPFKVEWEFGGTKPVAEVARNYNFFAYISDGYDDIGDSICYLRGIKRENSKASYGSNVTDRIKNNYPYPILRHHFGRPTMEETVNGICEIADAKVLDVISLGPDQNAQQYFFQQEKMNPLYCGAGGVPVRSRKDFIRLKDASMRGNFPLMRCYSGTEDVFKYAEMLLGTIDNAWAAVPIFWYNELDGRGSRTIENSIRDAHKLINWHAQNGIPVEINEPHHWGLRDAHDVIPVVMAYISAYTAKQLGVKNYIAQYMFNNPYGLSFSMDFAKVLAMVEISEELGDDEFQIYRETRAGLSLFHADSDIAKGQLAASTFMQMAINPHIIHVVGYCEANHAATAKEVIESCKIVKGVLKHTISDNMGIGLLPAIQERKERLISQARVLLNFIHQKYDWSEKPLLDADILSDCVKKGYFDAVHIKKDDKFKGNLYTKFIDGMCVAFDKNTNSILDEETRLNKLEKSFGGSRG